MLGCADVDVAQADRGERAGAARRYTFPVTLTVWLASAVKPRPLLPVPSEMKLRVTLPPWWPAALVTIASDIALLLPPEAKRPTEPLETSLAGDAAEARVQRFAPAVVGGGVGDDQRLLRRRCADVDVAEAYRSQRARRGQAVHGPRHADRLAVKRRKPRPPVPVPSDVKLTVTVPA